MAAPEPAPLAWAVSLLLLLALWWLVALLAADARLMPGPALVLMVAWRDLIGGDMVQDLLATLARVAAAFVLAMLVGTVLGWVAGRSARVNALLDPWIVVALNLPVLVVVILVYVWAGLNDAAAVLAVAIAKIPTIAITVREGARALDAGLDEMAAAFRLPWPRRLRQVVLPQLAPYLAAAGRGGLSVTWKIVLIVELLGRPNGVGFALNLRFQSFDVPGILAYGLVFAAIMLAVEAVLLQPWERRAHAWRAGA